MKTKVTRRVFLMLGLVLMLVTVLAACVNTENVSEVIGKDYEAKTEVSDDVAENDETVTQEGHTPAPTDITVTNITPREIAISGKCESGAVITVEGGVETVSTNSRDGYFIIKTEIPEDFNVRQMNITAQVEKLEPSAVVTVVANYDATAEDRLDGNSVTVGLDSRLYFDKMVDDMVGNNIYTTTELSAIRAQIRNDLTLYMKEAGEHDVELIYVLVPNITSIYGDEIVPDDDYLSAFYGDEPIPEGATPEAPYTTIYQQILDMLYGKIGGANISGSTDGDNTTNAPDVNENVDADEGIVVATEEVPGEGDDIIEVPGTVDKEVPIVNAVIDMKPIFQQMISEGTLKHNIYRNTDSSLSDYGAYLTYYEIMKYISSNEEYAAAAPLEYDAFDWKEVNTVGGNLVTYRGLDKDIIKEDIVIAVPKTQFTIGTTLRKFMDAEDGDYNYVTDKKANGSVAKRLLIDNGTKVVDEETGKTTVTYREGFPTALIYRDNATLGMVDMLADRFGEVLFAESGAFTLNSNDFTKAVSDGKTHSDYIIVVLSEDSMDTAFDTVVKTVSGK